MNKTTTTSLGKLTKNAKVFAVLSVTIITLCFTCFVIIAVASNNAQDKTTKTEDTTKNEAPDVSEKPKPSEPTSTPNPEPQANLGELCFSFSKTFKDTILERKDYWSWTEDKIICKNEVTEAEVRESGKSLGYEYCHNYNIRLKVQLENININEIDSVKSGIYYGNSWPTKVEDSIKSYDFSNDLDYQGIGDYFTINDGYLYSTISPYTIDSSMGNTANLKLKLVLKNKSEILRDFTLAIPSPFLCTAE